MAATEGPTADAAGRTIRMTNPDWWRQAAVYQIYPRSYCDRNGDGVGDLAGVLSRVDHIAALKVDAVWFSPFYPSALTDGGYDVDDYRDIDPSIGTLAEFDALVAALHECEIKVVVDLVPNHSSDRHEWFRAALASTPGSRERDRYLFRDGAGANGELPPNDWQAMFGGPAWTRVTEADGTPGQWYLHLFSTHQPDWNWANQEVRDDFLTTLRFWGDRGVDGFRVDVAMGLAKDMSEPFPPWEKAGDFLLLALGADNPFGDGKHPLVDRDELTEIYTGWRQVFNSYEPPLFAVAEAWVAPHRRGLYANRESLGQAFNFDLLHAPWDAAAFRGIIQRNVELAAEHDTTSTWVFSNHDVVRHASRFAPQPREPEPGTTGADGAGRALTGRGLARAEAAIMLALALPGSTYMYQGEELGLPEVTGIPADQVQDPWAVVENGVMTAGRDGCRVPLPWTTGGVSFGFGAADAHLPQPDWFGSYSVEKQQDDPSSTLSLYREALGLRRMLQSEELLRWLELGPGIVAFRRPNGWISVTNFGTVPVALPPGRVVLRSDRRAANEPLAAEATAWVLHPPE
ncbi:glycoside hydrolase family 13 protein [Streptomyces niveus]|uniref:glycoside hydrolase family 13 protein n=1 Tax=Streptomyces niveus TaxID=193462 RepID=UPI0033D6E0EF